MKSHRHTSKVNEAGRQCKASHRQVTERKHHKHGSFLQDTKDEIFYRWTRGQRTREIARNLDIPRERIEDVCLERVRQMRSA